MAETHTSEPQPRTPSVLVVLVVRDAAEWLRDCLQALAAQTYRPLGVIAVDNASTDGSREMLERALGPRRVLSLSDNRGVAGSVQAALQVPAAREAEWILVVHDDAALDPDAAARLVEAAVGIEGVERVGVVGAKIVDWEHPRILREVGRSTDRFGHPYTPLQDGELDQGQYDRVLEVLFVSSIAMLVSRECLGRVGTPDERFASHHEDLDFCWRARVAGLRVLMTPLARARHLAASSNRKRKPEDRQRGDRYYAERAALAAMLKNYALRSLAWLLPLYAVLGVARLVVLAVTRRFEDAYELLAAWGWNVAHLPGTWTRRRRAQRARKVTDRAVRRFMESAGFRLPRWFDAASRILAEQRELEEQDEGQPAGRRFRHQGASLLRSHPVVVASFLGALVGVFAFRDLLGSGRVQGAAVPLFPGSPTAFFRELIAGYRTTGLGGATAGSPALAVMGALSALFFASPMVAQKVLMSGSLLLGAVLAYRALARQTGAPFAAVVGATCYALSAESLWAFSQGRIALLVGLALLPALVDRTETAFGADRPRFRSAVGFGAVLALAMGFEPGIVLAVGVVVLVALLGAHGRGRGLVLVVASVGVAAALLLPSIPGYVAGAGQVLGSRVGPADFGRLARLALGPGPGTGPISWFLPVGAMLSFGLVGAERRLQAARVFFSGAVGLMLAWFSAAGYLPSGLANVPVYTGLVAVAEAVLVGYGVASVLGVRSEAFGLRQVAAGALAVVVAGGVAGQAVVAMAGGWAFGGPETIPPAWTVVRSEASGSFRVLWVGADTGEPFVAPGGDPQGSVGAVRYAITDQDGTSALDIGRGIAGSGDTALRAALREILSGSTRHGGALLAPFGVRYVVAAQGDLPSAADLTFRRQVDLDPVGAIGLTIFQNPKSLPPAGILPAGEAAGLVAEAAQSWIEQLPATTAEPLLPVRGGWDGTSSGTGIAFLSTGFSPAWRLRGSAAMPQRAFGWATALAASGGPVQIRYASQWQRTGEMIVLALLWAAALWVTRRPSSL